MADKKINKSLTRKLMDNISGRLSEIRQNTTFLPSFFANDTKMIKDELNASINSLITRNEDSVGQANMGNVYNRLTETNPNTDGKRNVNLESLFNSKQLTSQIIPSFLENKMIKEYEEQIDLLIKYYPTLQDILNVKKDHVLCADHYTRDFLNIKDKISNSSSNSDSTNNFHKNIEALKEKYNLLDFCDAVYDNCATYGETFIYTPSYNKAIGQLLDKKNKVGSSTLKEQKTISINEFFSPSTFEDDINSHITRGKEYSFNKDYNIKINMSKGIVENVVLKETNSLIAMNESGNLGDYKNYDKNKSVPDQLSFEGIDDGFTDLNKTKNTSDSLKLTGCLLTTLNRLNTIPIYNKDGTLFLGAYYIECEMEDNLTDSKTPSAIRGNLATMSSVFSNMKSGEKRNAISLLSSKISDLIDEKFINNNQDLKKEIYAILKDAKFNENGNADINVTFIPPSDIIHMKFQEDKKTHRGLSDLHKSIVPASIYVNLYITNAIGIITRGFDRRVYYVKNRVDTNISRTLLSVMNQLRRGNMGSRELANPKSALNVTGRYNDAIIPVGQSGDAPVSIENIPGQDIDTKQEFMEMLRELIAGPTDVPLDWIDQNKQVDFATRLTMTSYKFLRAINKRQGLTNRFFGMLIQRLYDAEYVNNESDRVSIVVELPTPVYLDQANLSEVYRVTNDLSIQIAEQEFEDPEDELIEVKKKLFIAEHNKRIMGSQLDRNMIASVKEYAIANASKYKKSNNDM